MITFIDKIEKEVKRIAPKRSAWQKGVLLYVSDLLEDLRGQDLTVNDLTNLALLDKALLNGAYNWTEYSFAGCSLIYNRDIARRLCTKYELKQTKDGLYDPSLRENWLDVQTRALYQAAMYIRAAVHNINTGRDGKNVKSL